jgi:hypothetical protein
MGALVVALAVCLLGVAVIVLRRGNVRAFPAGVGSDVPQRLLAASVTLLAADRAEWGQAMIGELDRLTARGERWRFVLGCARATLLLPPRRGVPGRLIVTVVASAAVACVGLVGYGLVRYPGVITGARSWVAVAAFLAVLVGYTMTANIIVRRMDQPALDAVRVALTGATVIAVLWIVLGLTASFGGSDYLVTLSLLALPLASLTVGALGTWRGRTASTGRRAAVLLALGTGMLVFLVWVGDTLLTGGRPYDAGMIRDFHSSGAQDLATYAVNDNMGSAMMLLLLVPMLAASFGLTGAAITARLLRRAPTTD